MITYLRAYGNHTNQIYEFVLGLLLSEKLKTKYRPLFVKELFPYYPEIKKRYKNIKTVVFYPIISFFLLVLKKLSLIKPTNVSNFSECKNLVKEFPNNKNIILDSWDYKSNTILFENEDLFQKKHQYLFNLFNTDITNIRGKYISEKINIALHIRRGDYIGYNGVCFYYSDEVYLNKVKELCKIIKTNNIRLIICTNDSELNKDFYLSEYPDTVFSKESFTTDHQLMAACDYIIGAPSSFSMWASFLGQTPCMHIYKPDAELTKKDFVIFESSPVSAF